MDPISEFQSETRERIREQGKDPGFRKITNEFVKESVTKKYMYNFSWMGRPIIQYPQDIVAMQEIIWRVKPDLVIETGIAHGGSIIFSASMLELLGGDRRVIGIDIDIRQHNRKEIESHPMFRRIDMIEASSVDLATVEKVKKLAAGRKNIMVILDSNHTHAHVLEELRLYSPFVTTGNYLLVFDTVVEDLPEELFPDRPWSRGDNPKTAVHEFLKSNGDFEIDKEIENKLMITVAPDGFLKRRSLREPH